MLRTALLSVATALIVAVEWSRLERPHEVSVRVVALVGLAVLPALVPARWFRAAAVVVVTVVGAGVAFSVSPVAVLPGAGGSFFTPIANRFGGAFADFYAFRLPVDPGQHARMHMLLLFAVFAFSLLVALAVAARRPVLAVAFFLVGAGWPATLLAGGGTLGRGALILVGALLLLAGIRGRGLALAAPAAAAVVLGALALSASPAVAKPGFLDWQHWNPYAHKAKPVSVSYVWDAQYGGLHFPKKVTTVLSIRAPAAIGTYWRATVLDAYTGDRWRERVWRETDLERNQLVPRAALDTGSSVQQEVTVDALSDRHLIAASVPVAYNVSEPAAYVGQDVAVTTDSLHRGQQYIAWSYIAEPRPQDLVASRPLYPRSLTRPGRELEIAGINAPAFATPNRDAILERRLAHSGPYLQLLRRARAVAGDTKSPYAAVVALERYLRTTGGFTYSNDPPVTAPGVPPLVAFVLQTKAGYCQHFAGAMALMARLLGVPARVAVGFVRGQYVDGTWTITDHDAHAWVEVWFRGYGWLPFDPTPGRGHLAASYSAASARFNAAAEAKLFSRIVRGGEVFGALGGGRTHGRTARVKSAADVGVRGVGPSASQARHHSLVLFLFVLVAAVITGIAVAKTVRRKARYLTRDPRRVAAACARELADFLSDQRFDVSARATFRELQAAIDERLGVDASTFAGAAETARFGPPAGARAAATNARSELRSLKRRLRRNLFVLDRARGFVSLRSLGFS